MGPYDETPFNLALRAERKAEQAVQTWRFNHASKFYEKAANFIDITLHQDHRLQQSLVDSLTEQKRFYLTQAKVCQIRRTKISHLLKDRSSLTFNLIKQAKQLAEAKNLLGNSLFNTTVESKGMSTGHHFAGASPTSGAGASRFFSATRDQNFSNGLDLDVDAFQSQDKINEKKIHGQQNVPNKSRSQTFQDKQSENPGAGNNKTMIDDLTSRFSEQMTLSEINRLFGEHNRLLDQFEQEISLLDNLSDIDDVDLDIEIAEELEKSAEEISSENSYEKETQMVGVKTNQKFEIKRKLREERERDQEHKSISHKNLINRLRDNHDNMRTLVCNMVEQIEQLKSENKKLKSKIDNATPPPQCPYQHQHNIQGQCQGQTLSDLGSLTDSQTDTYQLPPLEPPTLLY